MRFKVRRQLVAGSVIGAVSVLLATGVHADEGGISFWLPGQFGSLAAVPTEPGWALGSVYYHTSVDSGSNKETQRGGRVTAGLDAKSDAIFVSPTYTFATPVAGGQAAISVIGALISMEAGVNATLAGPNGATVSGSRTDSLTGGSDLYGLGTLKWNQGTHNYMAYTMVGAPVGAYQKGRLANAGTNHWSIDAGAGYTYFDTKNEFSVVMGFTHNFENDATDYKNGVDGHIDWGASRFVNATTHVGLVGYFYQQLTGDSGSGAQLGDYKSSVYAVGPQVGHFFAVGHEKWYINFKGYYEFAAENRPEGWNAWVSLLIPLSSAKK